MNNTATVQLLRRLWLHITPHRRKQYWLLLVLMLLASLSEVFTIGAVLPFLAVLTSPERIFNHVIANQVFQFFGFTAPGQLLLPLTILFGLSVIIAGIMRLFLLWASTRLTFATGADLGISIYSRTLYQPYSVHCARNSSEVINGITGKANSAIGAISQVIALISSSLLIIIILIALLWVDTVVALLAFSGFGLIYAFIIRLTSKQLLSNSRRVALESSQVIKALQEGLGGIRDVLIDGSQTTYCQIYLNADKQMRYAQGSSAFIAGSPRYGMEGLGILLIILLAYFLAQQVDGIAKAIPILGALALGAQRLLPVMQQVYASLAQINGSKASLVDALELLDQPMPGYADNPVVQQLPFNHDISIKQLGFRYSPQTPYVLKQLNLSIVKGSCVGFIGTTGSGKSTLLDIVMGLLQPTDGTLEIDGQTVTSSNQRGWQKHIAHVPQAIFLADSSIEENIAFGVPKDKIDHLRVKQSAQQAQIAESIESWPKQYQTFVGERGIRLSGGQRQRIGIARALYKNADVIVFDEATSALDNETEQAVMQAIENLSDDLTILIIAHRLTTLKNCTQIVELANGGIKQIGTYQQIVNLTV